MLEKLNSQDGIIEDWVEEALKKTHSFYREFMKVVKHYGVMSEHAATMKFAADYIQDAMISKSQQLSNNKTGSSVPKHTSGIAVKLRLFLLALEDSDKELKRDAAAGKMKVATYSSTGGNYWEIIFLGDDTPAECAIVDSDVMKAFCNKPNK